MGNDFLVEALMEFGYWDLMGSQEPELGREDIATDPDKLNAVWVLKELAGLGHVSESEKLLKDGRLMALCGFNVEVIRGKAFAGRPVVSRRTLYRHAERMPRSESEKMLLGAAKLAREHKWVRGRVYAADCFEIPVSGKKMEGIYENTDKKTRRGYKLLTITCITPRREQVVAAALGGICVDERVLLKSAFRSLQKVCEPRQMIDLLLLDRGFWKAQLMWELKHVWGIDFLTMAKEDLTLNDEVERLTSAEGKVEWATVYRKSGHTGENRRYRAHAVEGVLLEGYSADGAQSGNVNCVLAYASQPGDKERKRLVYITSEPTSRREAWAIKRYGERWVIENETMKWLSEHDARKMNGWSLNAVQYRLFLLLALRNAMTIVHWKYPKESARMRKLLAHRKRRSYIQGHGIIIYMQDAGVFGTYPSEEGMDMAEDRGARRVYRQFSQEGKTRKPKQPELPGIGPPRKFFATVETVANKCPDPRRHRRP